MKMKNRKIICKKGSYSLKCIDIVRLEGKQPFVYCTKRIDRMEQNYTEMVI